MEVTEHDTLRERGDKENIGEDTDSEYGVFNLAYCPHKSHLPSHTHLVTAIENGVKEIYV